MAKRQGFTLVELLITISIIAILAGMMVVASFSAQEAGKAQKTRALITKLDGIIRARYESYRTRRVPVNFATLAANDVAGTKLRLRQRVDVLRDLMRMELPDRLSDITDGPVTPFGGTLILRPPVSEAYLARLNSITTETPENQGAECLYMIVTESLEQEGDSRGVFNTGDVGDTDNDGLPEFLDGWKRPIEFLRWAPGFLSDMQNIAQVKGGTSNPSGQSVTITFPANTSRRFANEPSRYIRGAMAVIDAASGQINTDRMARITGYSWSATGVVFTCSTPTGVTTQKPFDGNPPTATDTVVIMPPDPLDSRGAYPVYSSGGSPPTPDTSVPTYALHPLIVSGGGDKLFGIKRDTNPVLQYTAHKLNPFVVIHPGGGQFFMMLGAAEPGSTTEPGWYRGCDLDNITNHSLQLK